MGSSFVKQAAILGIASLMVRLIGFLYRLPMTNLLGDEGMGFYTRAYHIYAFVVVISSGALPASISRLVSERTAKNQYKNAHELFKTAMGFALVIGISIALVMSIFANSIALSFDMPESAIAIRILAPTIIVVGVLAVFRGYFQGMKTTVPTAVSQVIEQIFNVVFTVALAYIFFDAANLQYSVAGGAAGTAIGAIAGVSVVAGFYFAISKNYRKDTSFNDSFTETRRSQVVVILKTSLPIIMGMGVYSLGTIIDFGMASNLMAIYFTESEINALVGGQFTNKFLLLTTLPVALSMALSAAVIPDITTSQVKMDMDAIKRKANMALRVSMMLTIPAAVGLSVMADQIIALLFPAHPDGGWLLRYGAISIVFIAMVQIFTGVFQGIGKASIPVIGAAIGVATKIPVNYFLIQIPQINILGAVISTIVCYLVATIINIIFLRKYTGITPKFGQAIIKPTIAAAGMGVVVYGAYFGLSLIAPAQFATVIALGVGMCAYMLLMAVIKGFNPDDVRALPMPARVKRWLC